MSQTFLMQFQQIHLQKNEDTTKPQQPVVTGAVALNKDTTTAQPPSVTGAVAQNKTNTAVPSSPGVSGAIASIFGNQAAMISSTTNANASMGNVVAFSSGFGSFTYDSGFSSGSYYASGDSSSSGGAVSACSSSSGGGGGSFSACA